MPDRILIIAEAGVNHNGSMELAKKLVDTAKECGADIVKFQTAKLSSLVSKSAPMAEYQKENTGKEESQKAMLSKLLLPFEDYKVLADYCREVGIKFLSTPFDVESIDFLDPLLDIWKVPSGEITNYPYLVKIAKTGKDIILSTGMCVMTEVEDAVKVLRDNGAGKITILHCTTNYPTPMEDVNLKAMLTLKERFGCDVGYSDHTRGIEVPIAAAALGAVVIEKHFCLDRDIPSADSAFSMEPQEFADMVKGVHDAELALGQIFYGPTEAEAGEYTNRRSLFIVEDVEAGEVLTDKNVRSIRSYNIQGMKPKHYEEVLGKKAKQKLTRGTPLDWSCIE